MAQKISNFNPRKTETVEEMQAWLVSQLAERLDLDVEDIDIEASFESYDLASADGLVLLSKLEEHLGEKLSPTLLWNYPTIEALSKRLMEEE